MSNVCECFIFILINNHTCISTSKVKTITPSRAWVADKAVGILRKDPHMGARELQLKLQEQYKVTVAYDTVWSGKEIALKEPYGKWEESFQMLYRWRAEVLERMPGSVVEIDTQVVDGKVYFHKFFCALKPCVDGFLEGCRPYLSIDSTALNGRWNGHLAAATGVDGNNWMYPVAFGFFDSETEANWSWFMSMLKVAIGEPPVLAICTDACKGLETAVHRVFPNAEQRECFRHLMQNVVKKFHGDRFGRMYPAARTYKYEVWHEKMEPLIQLPEFYNYLHKHHKLKWMRCAFNPAIKCDYITNNLAEVFNNWIKDIKDLPIVDLADKLREMIMTLWNKRRRLGAVMQGRILSTVLVQLRAKTCGLGHLEVVGGNDWSAEIKDNTKASLRHVVKLREMTCSCLEWQHTGKPCEHALAFMITQRNIDFGDFVHDYYSVAKFKAAYERLIEPMPDKSQWPQVTLPNPVAAPIGKRAVGRQRKQRIKSCLEGGGGKSTKTTETKTFIRGPVTCQRCDQKGHRQASYKCPLNGTKKR